MSDLARQELKAWIKAQREALSERRESWAHGAAETLADLERELDRIYGHQNAAPREHPLTRQARVMGARKQAECEMLSATMPEVGCPCRPRGAP